MVLSVWNAFSDEDGSVIYRDHSRQYMSSLFTIFHFGILHSQLSKSPVPCGCILFTVLHVTLEYMSKSK
jgi:hypothetical protein